MTLCLWGTVYIITSTSLTHWGRVTHKCVGNLTIIGSDNGLSPGRCQAIIWTNDVILWIRPLGTNFSEILIKFLTFSFEKMHLNVLSAKWRPFCLGLNVLMKVIRRSDWHYAVTWLAASLYRPRLWWWIITTRECSGKIHHTAPESHIYHGTSQEYWYDTASKSAGYIFSLVKMEYIVI